MRWGAWLRRAVSVTTVVGLGISAASAPVASAPARASGTTGPVRVVSPPEGAVPDLTALGWSPVFDEEFTGTAIDESVWNLTTGPGTSGPGTYRREAVRVVADPGQPGDGHLEVLTYSADTDGNGTAEHYTGEVQTNGQTGFGAAYGYIEAKVKLATAAGTRDAFWLLPEFTRHDAPMNDPAAAGPELDIFEIVNDASGDSDPADGKCDWQLVPLPCNDIVSGSQHWNAFDEEHTTGHQQFPRTTPSPQGNFVTYGLLWTPTGYRMYVNGVEYFRSSEAISASPEYLILSQHNWADQVPTGGYGALGAATNGRMTVDYIRAWQKPVSAVPDQRIGVNGSLAIPFSVTDFFSTSPSATVDPAVRTVQVTATSSNPGLVPNDHIVVTGNGPSDPDGTLANPGFESTLTGWTPSGGATTGTRRHGGTTALAIPQTGGKATQTITGLQPNTAYVIGGFWNVDLRFTDANGDGRLTWTDTDGDGAQDVGEYETLLEGGDAVGEFDFGVTDVDASRAGNQEVKSVISRNGWEEMKKKWWAPRNDAWANHNLSFTTGPNTTSVSVFVDNSTKTGAVDSDLAFDDLYVRPMASADRTVAIRPVDNASGTSVITLTAKDVTRPAAQQQLGTDQFTVTVAPGSNLANGNFEALPLGKGWDFWTSPTGDGAEVVVDDPFTLNRALELAGPSGQPDMSRRANGTAFYVVSNLKENRQYTVSMRGKGDLGYSVQEHGGPAVPARTVTSTGWTTDTMTFTTGASSTSAKLAFVDWDTADGVSLVDDVTVTPASTTGLVHPPVGSPTLTSLGAQTIAAGAPLALKFSTPSGTTVNSVTSSNQVLFPNARLGASSNGTNRVLALAPAPDRTGLATISVAYTDGSGPHTHTFPVTVTHQRLVNAGFEDGSGGWTLPATAQFVTGGGLPHSGNKALKIDGAGEVKGTIAGLPYDTAFRLGGWSKGGVNVTVRTVPDDSMRLSNGSPWPSFASEVTTGSWSGSAWTAQTIDRSTTQCPDCRTRGSLDKGSGPVFALPGAQLEVVLSDANPGDGQPVYVDDLTLLQRPAVRRIRDISLHQGQTSYQWNTRRDFSVGRVAPTSLWDTTNSVVTSSNTAAVPTSNLWLHRYDGSVDHRWSIAARAGNGATKPTGRSEVTMKVTDPATGLSSQQSFNVTINAGNNFNNGDFQSDATGWAGGGFNNSYEVVGKQRWRHLAPVDKDKVMRISSGAVGYRVTGLTPGTSYTVRANALGDGSTLKAVANNYSGCTDTDPATGCVRAWGSNQGSQAINNTGGWGSVPSFTFTPVADVAGTTENESDVWIFIVDASSGAAVPASSAACTNYAAGESCVDDIGVFRTADL